jgi:hypothetical protein
MKLSSLFIAMSALMPGIAHAAATPADAFAPTMSFYVAKGSPDACGPGCDSWIAGEGKVDSAAAGRLLALLRRLKDRKLPIYVQSPGGNLEQALAIGRTLRERKLVARVAKTIVSECGAAPPSDAGCVKLKQSGRELPAELVTRGAVCASACPFLLYGAPVREVAADAALAVHSPKINLLFHNGTPPKSLIAASMRQGLDRADRNMAAYLAEMGIGHGLLDLIRTVKFESFHVLTREEIVRFGIDRREFVETPWMLETGSGATVRKFAIERREGSNSFRSLQWRLSCAGSDEFRFNFDREADESNDIRRVWIAAEAGKSLQFGFPPFKGKGVETWQLRISKTAVRALAELPQLDIAETSVATNGQQAVHLARISTVGLTASLASLLVTCSIPPIAGSWTPFTSGFKFIGTGDATSK